VANNDLTDRNFRIQPIATGADYDCVEGKGGWQQGLFRRGVFFPSMPLQPSGPRSR
jgi:hypothetical protein